MPDSIREKSFDRFASGTALLLGILNQSFIAASLLLVLAIFSYTEFNPQTDSIGFPHRLFVLPVTSFLLVAVPIWLGVAVIELVALSWRIVMPGQENGDMALSGCSARRLQGVLSNHLSGLSPA
jgi:hypothetical protein